MNTSTSETPTIPGPPRFVEPHPASTAYCHYLVERRPDGSLWELGRGGMGVTYKAMDTNLHCPVALKIIGPQCFGGEDGRRRFVREARHAAQIRHPNVAAIYHLDTQDGEFFYSMEFVDGVTVAEWVKRDGPMSVELALDVCMQVARALTAADRLKLVHRDIKPGNIMILPDPANSERVIVKLIDFGLARSLDAEAPTAMTTCAFAGTPQYASPEQAENLELDIRSDIYSLGCTLWFLLSGEAPFRGSAARVIAQHLTSEPPWERLQQLSPSVRHLLRRMLAKDAAARPQDPVALHTEICACRARLKRSGFPRVPALSWENIRPRLSPAGAGRFVRSWAAAAGVLVAVGAWMVLTPRNQAVGTQAAIAVEQIAAPATEDPVQQPTPANVESVPLSPPELQDVQGDGDGVFRENELAEETPTLPTGIAAADSDSQALALELPPPDLQPVDLESESAFALALEGPALSDQPGGKANLKVAKKTSSRTSPRRRSREASQEAPFRPVQRIHRSVEGFVRRIF